jgi:hypothetical protein
MSLTLIGGFLPRLPYEQNCYLVVHTRIIAILALVIELACVKKGIGSMSIIISVSIGTLSVRFRIAILAFPQTGLLLGPPHEKKYLGYNIRTSITNTFSFTVKLEISVCDSVSENFASGSPARRGWAGMYADWL